MAETIQSSKSGPASRAEAATAEIPKPGLELLIGSNIFRNTNGVVKIHGKEQLVVEAMPDQGLLLVTIDLYGEGGVHIAHLRRNVLALNQAGRFAIDTHRAQSDSPTDAPWVRLSDRQSGETVLEALVVSENRVQITSGKFFSHKGALVEITPHYCRIGSGTTLFGDIVENRGGTVVLG
jgi:hypothetical protein